MSLTLHIFRGAGLPACVPEYRFHPTRKWRFDYAWPSAKVALEIEGGAWIAGRHTRGSGFVKDLEKYSEAAASGWLVVRVQPHEETSARTLDWLRRACAGRTG